MWYPFERKAFALSAPRCAARRSSSDRAAGQTCSDDPPRCRVSPPSWQLAVCYLLTPRSAPTRCASRALHANALRSSRIRGEKGRLPFSGARGFRVSAFPRFRVSSSKLPKLPTANCQLARSATKRSASVRFPCRCFQTGKHCTKASRFPRFRVPSSQLPTANCQVSSFPRFLVSSLARFRVSAWPAEDAAPFR